MSKSAASTEGTALQKRSGLTLVHRFPPGVRIVSTLVWKGIYFIATTRGIYYLEKPKGKIKEVQWKDET